MPLSVTDRLDIHELIALHGHLADDRRPDRLDELLTADAVYDISDFGMGTVEGLDAIRALFELRPGEQPRGHHVTNVVIVDAAEDGHSAHIRSKGIAVMADGTASTVIYADTVVRTERRWRISRRAVIGPMAT
jgi:SnoaL-like domain